MNRISLSFTTFLCILCFILLCFDAKASDISKCDYDDFLIGNGSIEISGGKYIFNFATEMDSYTFEGASSAPLVSQVQKAIANAKPDPESSFGKTFVLLTSMEAPICATAYESASLYIQPDITEKASHYIVGVCIPESSDCWKVKIVKFSPSASHIKNGTLDLSGKVAVVTYTDDGTVLAMYEDMNADY